MYYNFQSKKTNFNKILDFVSELNFKVSELEMNINEKDNLNLNQNLQELQRIFEQINYCYYYIINK